MTMRSRKVSMCYCIAEKWELRETGEDCKDSACHSAVVLRGKSNLSCISSHYIKQIFVKLSFRNFALKSQQAFIFLEMLFNVCYALHL